VIKLAGGRIVSGVSRAEGGPARTAGAAGQALAPAAA